MVDEKNFFFFGRAHPPPLPPTPPQKEDQPGHLKKNIFPPTSRRNQPGGRERAQ